MNPSFNLESLLPNPYGANEEVMDSIFEKYKSEEELKDLCKYLVKEAHDLRKGLKKVDHNIEGVTSEQYIRSIEHLTMLLVARLWEAEKLKHQTPN